MRTCLGESKKKLTKGKVLKKTTVPWPSRSYYALMYAKWNDNSAVI